MAESEAEKKEKSVKVEKVAEDAGALVGKGVTKGWGCEGFWEGFGGGGGEEGRAE